MTLSRSRAALELCEPAWLTPSEVIDAWHLRRNR